MRKILALFYLYTEKTKPSKPEKRLFLKKKVALATASDLYDKPLNIHIQLNTTQYFKSAEEKHKSSK